MEHTHTSATSFRATSSPFHKVCSLPRPMADAYGRAPYGGDRGDEEDAAMSREWQAQKDATVFLVDCGQSMSRSISLRGSKDAGVSHRGVDLALHLIETSLRNTCVHGRLVAWLSSPVHALTAACRAQHRVQRHRPLCRRPLQHGAPERMAPLLLRARAAWHSLTPPLGCHPARVKQRAALRARGDAGHAPDAAHRRAHLSPHPAAAQPARCA